MFPLVSLLLLFLVPLSATVAFKVNVAEFNEQLHTVSLCTSTNSQFCVTAAQRVIWTSTEVLHMEKSCFRQPAEDGALHWYLSAPGRTHKLLPLCAD